MAGYVSEFVVVKPACILISTWTSYERSVGINTNKMEGANTQREPTLPYGGPELASTRFSFCLLLRRLLLLRPGRSAEYCDQPVYLSDVCLSVCPWAYLWNRWTDRHKILYTDPCGRGSVLLRRRCSTLCTSGFMDDVAFGRNGRDAGKGWQHSELAINYVRDRGGVWCLWMLVVIL